MVWTIVLPAILSAATALIGVGYGASLSGRQDTLNWTREQRLKAYADLLGAIENCYEAFTLIAAALDLHKYVPSVDGHVIEQGCCSRN
jgi:hypothetical protein